MKNKINALIVKKGKYKIKSKNTEINIHDITNKINHLILNKECLVLNNFTGTNLTKITFNENLEEIKDFAFCDNKNLKELVFPKCLDTIRPDAFCGCTNLESITFNSFPAILYNSFKDCNNIKIINFIINEKSYTINLNDYKLKNIKYDADNNIIKIKYKNDYEEIIEYIDENLIIKKEYILLDIIDKIICNNKIIIPNKYNTVELFDRVYNAKEVDFRYINDPCSAIINIMGSIKKIILPAPKNKQKIDIQLHDINYPIKIIISNNINNLDNQQETIIDLSGITSINIFTMFDNYIIKSNNMLDKIICIITSEGKIFKDNDFTTIDRIIYEYKLISALQIDNDGYLRNKLADTYHNLISVNNKEFYKFLYEENKDNKLHKKILKNR